MLRVIQNRSAAGAKSYYSKADYLTESQELTGRWGGKGAMLLGLAGEVQKHDFDALCDNQHPLTGQKLTPRVDTDRTVGYDFTFDVPKSVSIAYTLNRDERILDAFRSSIRETMDELEADMKTRVRRAYRDDERTTGNIVYAEFIHKTARPVEGIPDPHLHAHCFVQNVTFCDQENRWKAGQFRDIKRDAPYFEAAFHARLGQRLEALGYPIARRGKQWDLAGIPKSLSAKFSRRTEQIEKLAQEKGIENPDEKSQLGAKSREQKQNELSLAELRDMWQQRLTPEERHTLNALTKNQPMASLRPQVHDAESKALDHSIAHVFERKSVAPKREILAEALRYGVGQVDVEKLKATLSSKDVIVRPIRGREMATTKQVLAEENSMLNWASRGKGKVEPLNRNWKIKREWLNAGQKAAVRHVLESRDLVTMISGDAGTGKTSLMQEAADGIRAGGHEVFAVAPSAEASKGVLREEGFESATTLAELLVNEQLQQKAAGQVLWCDEAGLVGTRTMKQVFDLAERIEARVIISGDWKQHGSVERGAAMRLLEQEAGIRPARVTDIQRQKGVYREAVALLANGHTLEGFDKLDELGWVKEIQGDERDLHVARDYADGIEHGENILLISPTHYEAGHLNSAVRQELKDRKLVGKSDSIVPRFVPLNLTEAERADPAMYYEPGTVIVFHQNAKGHKKGERLVIGDELQPDLGPVAKHFQVYRTADLPLAANELIRITANGSTKDRKHTLNNGSVYQLKGFTESGDLKLKNGWIIDRQFGFLNYGAVSTSPGSQGKTVDRVILAESSLSFPAASREQGYVSLSRGRKQATVYTNDNAALRDAISRSDERMGATELVRDKRAERTQRLTHIAAETRIMSQRKQPEPSRKQELVREYD